MRERRTDGCAVDGAESSAVLSSLPVSTDLPSGLKASTENHPGDEIIACK